MLDVLSRCGRHGECFDDWITLKSDKWAPLVKVIRFARFVYASPICFAAATSVKRFVYATYRLLQMLDVPLDQRKFVLRGPAWPMNCR